MKKFIIFILLIFPISVHALNNNATSSILMDIDTGRIMYSNNIHERRSVASISKIMTAVIALENGKLDKKITVGDEINKAYGSGIYIKKGEILTLKDLLYGLLLRSGNDAAFVIEKNISKNFVDLMNKKAKKLGMNDSEFNNTSGLDNEKGNYSSAYDMALLMSYAYKNKDLRKIIKTHKYQLKTNFNTYIWYNKNKLLTNYKYSTGGKTGYTKKAKRTLVSTASKDNLNLVVVTLNDSDDWNDHKELFEYGFNNYKKYKILDKRKFKVSGDKYYKDYKLYIKNNYSYTLYNEEINKIHIVSELKKVRKVKNKQVVGECIVYLENRILHKEKIYIKTK